MSGGVWWCLGGFCEVSGGFLGMSGGSGGVWLVCSGVCMLSGGCLGGCLGIVRGV